MRRDHRLTLTLVIPALACAAVLLTAVEPSSAQEPPATVPPSAIRSVRPLRYVIQDMAGRIDDLRVKESPTEYRIELAADVLFDFDKAELRPEAVRVLTAAATFVGNHAVGPVRVEGHTDAKGTNTYNARLSTRRAHAVATWLATTGGLGSTTFAPAGFGSTRPVAPNTKPDGSDDPDGRQLNRRVEIIIMKGAKEP